MIEQRNIGVDGRLSWFAEERGVSAGTIFVYAAD
jgi:hypothetical protein